MYGFKELIINHLKTKNIQVKEGDVHFNAKEEYQAGDWRGELPTMPVFDNVTCKGKEIEK